MITHDFPVVGFLLEDLVGATLWAGIFSEQVGNQTYLRAMPLILAVLCILAIAYRYYSAFLAAKVVALDDSRATPAHTHYDGQNYHPTNKWVLFGHHFAAISGAGPLIGPVLAIQYGYMPGLLWLVIGVCLAGAVQDMLVLAASVRRDGKSLAEIARAELGRPAGIIVSLAILFIVIMALAGLGIVVVKALGGETVKLEDGTHIVLASAEGLEPTNEPTKFRVAEKAKVVYPGQRDDKAAAWGQAFYLHIPAKDKDGRPTQLTPQNGILTLPAGSQLEVQGSSWGTFTIFCTVPIALFVGLYMYRIRKGRVVEASLIGAAGVLIATVMGSFIPHSPLHEVFSLNRDQTVWALAGYGFIASVLPVWMLLCPRDYLSSFLKIGTIALLVVGLILANPVLKAPQVNEQFLSGGPTFKGSIFPFVFICVMCGAISGFHALVSSGTTPKMVDKETQVRPIGYGAMLMEGLVGVVALLAAASLDPADQFFEINTDLSERKQYQAQIEELRKLRPDPIHQVGVRDLHQLPVLEQEVGETLRGRTGGAVTLAVGIAVIFTDALANVGIAIQGLLQYWYHFAIMFEALFILTTIDTGTRIARFLLQEALGKVHPKFEQTDWLPGAVFATGIVTAGWALLIATGSISTIWPMFGIANQLLAVIALSLVTTWLVNTGRGKYVPVTILPMLWVTTTTMTAGAEMVLIQFPARIEAGQALTGYLSIGFSIFVMASVGALLLIAVARWVAVLGGKIQTRAP